VQLTKQGFAFVFRPVTGKPVWPIVERRVPTSDTPGERTSPTRLSRPNPRPMSARASPKTISSISRRNYAGRRYLLAKQYKLAGVHAAHGSAERIKGTVQLPAPSRCRLAVGAFDPETDTLLCNRSPHPSSPISTRENPRATDLDMCRVARWVRRPQACTVKAASAASRRSI